MVLALLALPALALLLFALAHLERTVLTDRPRHRGAAAPAAEAPAPPLLP